MTTPKTAECVCQDQHRRGRCTEPGCPYSITTDKTMEPTDQDYWYFGGLLHEARMKECFGNWYPSWRSVWPENVKEFRRQRHAGQPWIDVACAQVRALKEDRSELRKLQEIIDNQADRILDLHEILSAAYKLHEFIAGNYILSLADFRYLNNVSTQIKEALENTPSGEVGFDDALLKGIRDGTISIAEAKLLVGNKP